MVWWLSMRTHKGSVVSSIFLCVTVKYHSIGKEGNGKPPHKIPFPRKDYEMSPASVTLQTKKAMQCKALC